MGRVKLRRIGLLTGGGDCPGLNAVIRAVVKTAIGVYDLEVIGFEDGFEGLIEPSKARPLTTADVRGILPRGGTILGTTNRGNPFAYKKLEGGMWVTRDLSKDALARIEELKLDALLVIGGDGSLKIGNELFKLGVPVVGIPKTIDNDLSATDVTFGFDTALNTATEALDKLHTTAESHHRVMIVEVMGRNAGWIAVESGIAGGADVILIPEIPFVVDKVCDKVHERDSTGRKFSIVVAAEGAKPKGGTEIVREAGDEIKLARLGGIGDFLADKVALCSGHEVRVTVLGHLQRGGSPTPFDRILGTRYGAAAVKAACEGNFGTMVALHTPNIVTVPLQEAVALQKLVPPDGELVQTARCVGTSFGD